MNTQTGELYITDETTITVPCATRFETDCASCARTYRKRTHLVIASGLPTPGETAAVFLVTLTAPSFGAVHLAGWKKGTKRPRSPRRCRCGRVHNPERSSGKAVIGSPLNPAAYNYRGAVAWNACAPKLWSAWKHRVSRALAEQAPNVAVQMCRIAEPQRRGSVHFHAVLVFRAEAGAHLPASPLLQRMLRDTLPSRPGAAGPGRPGPEVRDPHTRVRLRFGVESDVRELRPRPGKDGGPAHWGAVSGYLAKYLTKSTGAAGIGDAFPEFSPIGDHLYRLGKVAKKRALEVREAADTYAQLRPGDLVRVQRGCGYSGPPRSSTRDWGITLGQLKAEARAWTRERLGLPAVPVVVRDWSLDWVETKRFRAVLQAESAARQRPVESVVR